MAKEKKQKGKMDMQAMMKIYHYPRKLLRRPRPGPHDLA